MIQPFKYARSRRPTFSIRQVTPRLGGRRIRSRLGNIWQLLARTSACLELPKDTLETLHKFRYLRSIPRFNQNSKSVDFGLSSPSFVTHSPILVTHLVRTVPCPWFNCSARPRLVTSSSRIPCFFVRSLDRSRFTPVTTLPEQRYIASDFQTANGRSQSLASPTSACADDSSARVPLGHFPRPTRDRDTRPDGLGPL